MRADGSAPVAIAQVQVDGAWRAFTLTPDAPIGRLGAARLDIPYPWVEGEAHHVALLTGTGAAFDYAIEVAQATPAMAPRSLAWLTLVGLLLGLAPVAIGLMAYPALRRAGPGARRFVLALTVGLLVYLLIDTLREGLELGADGARPAARRDAGLGRRRSSPPRCCSGSAGAAAWRRAAWRSPASSRSASACTTSARGWWSAARSPPARRRSPPTWWSASCCTTSPRGSASPRR